jgi:hypothetical protein
MLWIEVTGTYKFKKEYKTFRWDFCDLHCLNDFLKTKMNWEAIGKAKHKVKKKVKK